MKQGGAALVALILLTIDRVKAAADESEAAHRAMCALTEAASATFTAPSGTADNDGLNDKIQAANMSVADAQWQALFDDGAGSKPYDQTTSDNRTLADKLGGKEKWDGWRKAFADIKALNIGTKTEGEYPKINSEVERTIARQQLRSIAAQANKLEMTMKPLKAFLSDGKINKINENLRKALYGGDGELSTPTLGASFSADGSSWNNLCKGKENRKSIAGDFFCICTGAGAGTKQCSGAYGHTRPTRKSRQHKYRLDSTTEVLRKEGTIKGNCQQHLHGRGPMADGAHAKSPGRHRKQRLARDLKRHRPTMRRDGHEHMCRLQRLLQKNRRPRPKHTAMATSPDRRCDADNTSRRNCRCR
uniref:Variant surface glycoprotein n=1 Tax=Trypanosoma brucei TaxID=5691 RepID=A0A1V0FZD2_9TRYP|nr:variant surface glycoprotein [Trypanosoma brucei]